MLKKMLINAAQDEECRVAVVCDGLLEELDVQVRTYEATLGNIYKGVASRIEPALQAVFVEYGASRNGFLSINDVHPSYFPESFEQSKRRPRIQDVFKKDDHVLVQVSKEERGNKGACLTTNISLAGRYLVLMPGTDLYGVSRKIEDEKERKKLKEIVKQLKMPPNMGFIIRTAGMGRSKTELSRDLDYLLKLWDSIETNLGKMPSPALLYKEHDIVIRSIREHFSMDIAEILVDDKDVFKRVKDFFNQVMPKYEPLVKLYQEKRPIFNKYQLEEQVESVYRRKIKLKSGGHILIEPTEAMVTIDVNSGSATKEKGIEETAYRVNMEAAFEVARQLRLRDLGGIIVIDFIDMGIKKHNQDVEKALKSVLKTDRAKTKVLRINALGLLELSRQRLQSALGTGEYLECSHCDGQGRVRSPETSAISIFRRIKSLLSKNDGVEVRATLPAKTAEYLLNNMRAQLFDLEKLHNARVVINMRPSLPDKDIVIEAVRDEPVDDALRPPETQVAVSPVVAQPLPAPLSVVAALVAEPISLVEEQPEVATEEDEKKPRRTGKRRRGRGKPKPSIEEMRASAQEVFPEESYKPTVSETMGVGFKRESSSTWMDTPEPDESPFSESEVDLSEDSLSMASDAQIQDFIPVAAAEEAPLVTAHDNPDAEVGCEHIPYGDDPWARDIPEPARFEFDARSAAEPEVESYPDSPPETHAEEPAAREEVTVADDASVESYVETPEPENIAGSLFDTHDETWDPSEVVVPVSAASVDEAAVVSAESASETPTEIEQEIDAFDASLTAPEQPTEALVAADPVELPVEGTESVVLSETDTAPSDAIPEELPPQTVTLEGESAEESPETTDETPPPKEKGASKPLRRKNLLQGYLPFS